MLTIPVYNPAGERIGEETIDPADFGGEINKQLLHDVVLMHLAARRVGTVNTRGRADVAGSGKKIFRQKGTGNARAGSKRTNKRKGGGVAFARRNRDYRYSMPKKAVRIAIRMALLSKFQDGQALVLDGLALSQPRTSEVARALRAIRRPDLSEAEATEAVGETKAQAPQADPRAAIRPPGPARPRPGHAPQRPQHRGRQGRPGGRVQHLRHPQAALPGAHPRGPGQPQGAGQAQADPPPRRRPTARLIPRRGGHRPRRPPPRRAKPWSPCVARPPPAAAAPCSSRTRSSSAP